MSEVTTAEVMITSNLMQLIKKDPELQTPEMTTKIATMIKNYYNGYINAVKDHDKESCLASMYKYMDKIKLNPRIVDKISCRKGCAHCCHIQVTCTQIEVDTIKAWCDDENITIDKEYLKKQQNLDIDERPASEYSACVFLNKEDNTCKIYEVRPVACRKYFVVTPAEKCDVKLYPKTQVAVHADINLEMAASAINMINNGEQHNFVDLLLQD